MKPILKRLGSATLAAGFALGAALPATTALAQFGGNQPNQFERRNDDSRRGDNDRGRFERRGNTGYFNGNRGYRDHRPGYRYHSGFWFPPAAFIAGAIIGGAVGAGNPHVQWCLSRYRSYDRASNTFQPNYGPRQYCVSPYG